MGGDGRDTLISNAAADRLIDWSGNYDSFVVPWSSKGGPTIIRSHNPHIVDFLIKLSRSRGADQTRTGTTPALDYGELGLPLP